MSAEAKFEIVPGDGGDQGAYYWHLKAANGEIIAQSEGYTTKEGAERGVDAVKRGVLAVLGIDTRKRLMQTTFETIEEIGGKLSVVEPEVRSFVAIESFDSEEIPA
jgi:uncharacterized protein